MKNLTDITLILDDSGSMTPIAVPTVMGINAFIQSQKKIPDPAVFSLVRFHEYGHLFWQIREMPMVSMGDLATDSYKPDGPRTALYDSASRIIDQTGQRLAAKPEVERPNKVLIAIMTDGLNNVGAGYTANDLNRRINHQRTVYSWEFIYLGANQDAIAEARKIAIPINNAMNYAHSAPGTAAAFANFAASTTDYRMGKLISMP